MQTHDENAIPEVTQEQIDLLLQLGLSEEELQGLNFDEAEELISEIQAQRQDAGKVGRD
jgi:hypothetical protein